MNTEKTDLKRSLNTLDATALVIGSCIGTGVFLKTASMSQTVGSPFWVLAAWIAAGILSLAGSFAYAELGSLFPHAGGEFVFLKEAYGKFPAYLYGWMRFWIGSPATIAAYAVGAATFLSSLLPSLQNEFLLKISAVAFIVFFTILNCLTLSFGGKLQTFLTALKFVMVIGLMIAIFIASDTASWSHLWVEKNGQNSLGSFPGWSAFGTAMLAALWAYDGWNNLPMAAGEIKNPNRAVPIALTVGMIVVAAIYVLSNLSYFYALPFDEILNSNSSSFPNSLPVGTKAAQTVFGAIGVGLLSVAFTFSAVSAMNGSILAGARVPYAMAKDGLFFKKLAQVSPKTNVPATAVLVQGLWSCLLALSGSFDQLTDYVVFASWLFYALVTGSLFIFRKKIKYSQNIYKVPAYPIFPALFLLASTFLIFNTIYTGAQASLVGLGLIAAGVPFYFLFRKK